MRRISCCNRPDVPKLRPTLIWLGLGAAMIIPLIASVMSPLLAWRDAPHIVAGIAGVVALGLLLIQPLLPLNLLPGLAPLQARRMHRRLGIGVLAALALHIAGLWITSPPDVIDILLLRAPTAFSVWGVIAMWAVVATALIATLRHRLSPRIWRMCHAGLAVLIVAGTVLHAMLIEGTMETVTKTLLCGLVVLATLRAIAGMRLRRRRKP